MNTLNDWGRVLVSTIVVFGFIGVTVLYMTRKLDGAAVPEILSILLGCAGDQFYRSRRLLDRIFVWFCAERQRNPNMANKS
jgi:hypothetical protein